MAGLAAAPGEVPQHPPVVTVGMMMLRAATLLLPCASAQIRVEVSDTPIAATSDHFTCWNIDASANRGFFWRDLDVTKPYGKQLARQAAAITAHGTQAHSLVRFGGSGNDMLTYEFGQTECPPPRPGPPPAHWEDDRRCLNQTTWKNLLGFVRASNARIIFGISQPKWAGCGPPGQCKNPPCTACPPWDPANAREILEWTIGQGLDALIYGFEVRLTTLSILSLSNCGVCLTSSATKSTAWQAGRSRRATCRRCTT